MKNILLLHGALGSKKQLFGLESILNSNFNCVTLNFEGHGDHASEKAFSIDLFTQNVINFLQENQIENTHIFGYSMGGYVALNLAIKKPELVGKIMTYGTKFDWTPESAEKEVKMLNPEKIEEKVPAFAHKLQSTHTANDWKDVMNKTAQMMLELGNGARLEIDDFSRIQQNVLISIGTKDHMVSIEESKIAANSLPNGKLFKFESEPHMIEQLDADQLSVTLIDFLGIHS